MTWHNTLNIANMLSAFSLFLCLISHISHSKEQKQHVPCRWVKELKNLLEMTFITLSANVTAWMFSRTLLRILNTPSGKLINLQFDRSGGKAKKKSNCLFTALSVNIQCTFDDKMWVVQLKEPLVIKAVNTIYWWFLKLHELGALLDMYIYGGATGFTFNHSSRSRTEKNNNRRELERENISRERAQSYLNNPFLPLLFH